MHWYLVHTKPRQEKCALENLQNQGYQCYLPTIRVAKGCRGTVEITDGPLFPRYLFIKLGQDAPPKGTGPIRHTKSISRLVSVGAGPIKISARLIEELHEQEAFVQHQPIRHFTADKHRQMIGTQSNGIKTVYQMTDSIRRIAFLINLISQQIPAKISPSNFSKYG